MSEDEPSVNKPTGISIRIKKADSDEESKIDINMMVLGKRPVRKWEKRWVLQPNVFDLNQGDIWI
jgi:hypothetical protein